MASSYKVLALNLRTSEWKKLKEIKKKIKKYQKENGLADVKTIGYVHIIRGSLFLAMKMLKRNPGLLYENIMKADLIFKQELWKEDSSQKG